jgi:uncharacterized integral membrane protein (TIGR00698 family)
MNGSAQTSSPARSALLPAGSNPSVALAAGVGLCLAIAVVAEYAARFAPLVGAPIIAIVIGVVLTNLTGTLRVAARLRIKEVSGYALRGGIVILGATLNLRDVVSSGATSLPILALTITLGLAFPLLLGRAFGVQWRMRCLIGMGTTICGASAIAALAPVLRAKTEDIAYSITVIFFFNMLAVFIFPVLGHAFHLSDNGFGMWAGTAVNDTSAVVAAGFAYSHAAGTYATIVKLTRTTLIIPLVLGFGLLMPWLDPAHAGDATHLGARLRQAVPWFIGLFVIASLVNTLGLIGAAAPALQDFARFVLVVALAAVGLQAHWRAFAGAGLGPLLLGLGTWAVVALSSLAVQAWTAQL